MKHTRFQSAVIVFLLASNLSADGQVRSPQRRQLSGSEIRKIDFRNFTYHSTLCSQELSRDGLGETVRVRNGQFKNAEVYYAVGKPIYGDLTNDNQEEAVITVGCNAHIANFSLAEVHVYGTKNQKVELLASFDDRQMESEYESYFPRPDGALWGINSVRVSAGNLEIDRFADGPMSCPPYLATFEYRLDGKRLALIKRPVKRASNLPC